MAARADDEQVDVLALCDEDIVGRPIDKPALGLDVPGMPAIAWS